MMRFPWSILVTFLVGVGLGLGYAWFISPYRIADAQPDALRTDFKDQFRSVVAAAYAATGNLPRAQARLAILGDENAVDALSAQAQRMLASSQTFERADQVAALASVLQGASGAPVSTPTLGLIVDAGETFTPTAPSLSDVSILPSETPEPGATLETVVGTQLPVSGATPGPTITFTPEPGEPFALTGQETVCDPNLPEGILQVLVSNRNRRQLAGVEITIAWDGGAEPFFTGLKPELGSGYADYIMNPDLTYTIQLARGSDVARGISAPTCQTPDGASFLGGVKLTFQQP